MGWFLVQMSKKNSVFEANPEVEQRRWTEKIDKSTEAEKKVKISSPLHFWVTLSQNKDSKIFWQTKLIKLNSVAFGPQANYTDRANAACRRC
jgi:hypothetical protein